jgi:hypothetical protein
MGEMPPEPRAEGGGGEWQGRKRGLFQGNKQPFFALGGIKNERILPGCAPRAVEQSFPGVLFPVFVPKMGGEPLRVIVYCFVAKLVIY